MKLVVERRSLKALVLLLIYKVILDYAYIGIIVELFGYMGMNKDINILKMAVSYVCVLGLWLITPTGKYKILDIFVNVQLLTMLIPMLTMYGANNENTQYMSVVLVCYMIQCLFCMIHKEHASVSVNTVNMNFDSLLLVIAFLIVCMCILIYGIPSLRALDILNVYEVRGQHIFLFPWNYLVPWCAKIIIPLGLILSLEEKKYVKSGIFVLLQIILYLSFAHKTYFFVIIVAGAVWYVCKKRWLYQALYTVFPIGVIGSVFLYKIMGNLLVISIFVRRVLMVPAFLKFTYYRYYVSHPKAFFHGSIIGDIFGLESSYEKSIAAQIGEYMGSPQTMMNTGYLGEGYAQGGYLVLIIMSLLLLAICKMCTLKKNINMNIFLPMYILWFYTLNDGALQTTLLTGGGVILLLLFAIWPERKNLCYADEKPVTSLGGGANVRYIGKNRYATWHFRR